MPAVNCELWMTLQSSNKTPFFVRGIYLLTARRLPPVLNSRVCFSLVTELNQLTSERCAAWRLFIPPSVQRSNSEPSYSRLTSQKPTGLHNIIKLHYTDHEVDTTSRIAVVVDFKSSKSRTADLCIICETTNRVIINATPILNRFGQIFTKSDGVKSAKTSIVASLLMCPFTLLVYWINKTVNYHFGNSYVYISVF